MFCLVFESLVMKMKENGECFHLSAFVSNDVRYWVMGSKNVHMVIRYTNFLEDLKVYTGDRYSYAREMALSFSNLNLKQGQQENLFLNLERSKNTFCAESISLCHQHLVKYTENGLRFFSASFGGIVSVLPDDFEKEILVLGLEPVGNLVSIDIDDKEKLDETRKYIREATNTEGAVVYVVTNMNRVYKMYKFKNNTYVFERAIRERMRSRSNSDQIRKRISTLHIDHPDKDSLLAYFLQFNAWCRIQESKGKLTWSTIFDSWVSFRDKFDTSLTPTERQDNLDIFDKEQSEFNQLQLMFIGPPGFGKSSLAGIIHRTIDGSVHLNQDMLGGKAKAYHREIKKASKERAGILILDKSNHVQHVRTSTLNVLNKQRLVYIVLEHPDGLESGYKVSQERILKRGWGHHSLHPGTNLKSILERFYTSYQSLTDDEVSIAEQVIKVDVTIPLFDSVVFILKNLGIDYDDEKLQIAYKQTIDAEQNLRDVNISKLKTLYWSIELDQSTTQKLFNMEEVKKNVANLCLQKTLHSTMLYIDGKNKLTDEQLQIDEIAKSKINTEVNLVVTGICYNEKAVALRISSLDVPMDNEHPHITLATSKGTQPYYSNHLLSTETGHKFIDSVRIKGIMTRNVCL